MNTEAHLIKPDLDLAEEKIYSLRQVATAIRKTLDQVTGGATWLIRAEVVKVTGLLGVKHVYVDLVEQNATGIQAKMKAMIWAADGQAILRDLGEDAHKVLAAGQEIVFSARVHYSEVYGLALHVERIEMGHMLGEMERKRQETIQKLTASRDIFQNRELDVPLLPHRIALAGSKGTSGYRDFATKMAESGCRIEVKSFQATVQGKEAPGSLIQALEAATEWSPDLIVMMRGGGSKMDLACFDDYELCKSLAHLPHPFWTGIGHESDLSVADLCANQSFKTPTELAMGIIQLFAEFEVELDSLQQKLAQRAWNAVEQYKMEMGNMQSQLGSHSQSILFRGKEWVSDLTNQLGLSGRNVLTSSRIEIHRLSAEIQRLSENLFVQQTQSLKQLAETLNALHPDRTLERGFAIVRNEFDQVIKSPENLASEDEISIELRHHIVQARAQNWHPKTKSTQTSNEKETTP